MAGPQSGAFQDIHRRLGDNEKEHDTLWKEIEKAKQIARQEAQSVRVEHKNEHDKIWTAIEALRNRLPLWATLLISVLVAIVSVALSFAGTVVVRIIFK